MEKQTYSIPEAAVLLGISRNLLYQLARQEKIPVLRLGQKRIVIPRKTVERWLETGLDAR